LRAICSSRAISPPPPIYCCRRLNLRPASPLPGSRSGKFANAHFTGIDLSPGMIERARATGLYAQLEVAEMVEGMRGKPDASADLILAADAMIYLSDLAPLLGEARRVLAAGGLLAFTVETHRGEGVILGEGLRYAHSADYVRASIEACGLALSRCEDRSARPEDNAPVPGLVVVLPRLDCRGQP
jgi:predicted TPR repeat methyltransferase